MTFDEFKAERNSLTVSHRIWTAFAHFQKRLTERYGGEITYKEWETTAYRCATRQIGEVIRRDGVAILIETTFDNHPATLVYNRVEKLLVTIYPPNSRVNWIDDTSIVNMENKVRRLTKRKRHR